MPRVRWTPAARRHIDELFDDVAIERGNPTAAPAARSGRRDANFLVGSYVTLYRAAEDGVEVLAVAHGARDLPRLFRILAGDGEEE